MREVISEKFNVKVITGDTIPDEMLIEDALKGDRFSQIRLEAYGAYDIIRGQDDGEWQEPKYNE